MHKLADITGQQFGKLTVVAHARKASAGQLWLCRCECGKESAVYGSNLRRGRTRSCGGCNSAVQRGVLIEITGQRFGRWTVVARASKGRKPRWLCICECGTERDVLGDNLRNGQSISCGCFSREVARENCRRIGKLGVKHGYARHGMGVGNNVYRVYAGMIQRCHNPKTPAYKNYGARGVQVAEPWRKSFEAFLADVGERPSRAHSLDRVNPFGNYEPGNVRWATNKEQMNNRRANWLEKENERLRQLLADVNARANLTAVNQPEMMQ